ncbi:MarR family winged helix-turn-helix transcriptional regulator [Mycolicibacterium poriferae]|uniref:MarR family winged helix-turn-helix transcriptional regulator n=1 Tax=Mycolicibacterium poriferae TaxID=39694 RepID=UPI0013D60B1C|nr:MarR family winged helix-turn-helix transcriptional regulator [Mycolicibacterium poriferae]MCV7261544.1 winged helix-turn-helix transcriptional regulator [Mycolicibacterium poriferae]
MASLRIDDQMCFALYTASRTMTAAYRPLLADLGITYPQYLVMLALWEDGPSSVGQLCERLSLDSGTLSPLLKRLEATGYITRQRSMADERRVDIALTSTGSRLRERAVCIPEQMFASIDMSMEDAMGLKEALQRLTTAILAHQNSNPPAEGAH